MSDTLSAKLLSELKDGLLICYRVKDHRLDYSIMNRPEPTLSGLDDHALATAIVYAVKSGFALVHNADFAETERVERSDGRTVTYNETVEIDFVAKKITSSRRTDMTRDVLGGIVTDLMRRAPAPTRLGKVVN